MHTAVTPLNLAKAALVLACKEIGMSPHYAVEQAKALTVLLEDQNTDTEYAPLIMSLVRMAKGTMDDELFNTLLAAYLLDEMMSENEVRNGHR